ncbi:MAG: zinc-ribbon domain-containing protein [Candidatus Thorarchaeota archaeon]
MSERLIILGFALALIGFLVIALTIPTTEAGFVYVFPFFFVGDISGPFMIPILVSMLLMFTIFFFWLLRTSSPTEIEKYVKIAALCEYCGNPIPDDSAYCPSCGRPFREDSADSHEQMY